MRSLAAAQRARRFLDEGCVIVDFETTGFVSPSVDIVEIAVIDQDGQVLLDTLVRPEGHIPSRASQVHGIYDSDVKGAPSFREVFDVFRQVISAQPFVVAYNDQFERGILRAVCQRYTQPQLQLDWHCAMRTYMAYAGQGKFSKLGMACEREGVRVENAHRALGDCAMTLHLLRRMASYAENAGAGNQDAGTSSNNAWPRYRS